MMHKIEFMVRVEGSTTKNRERVPKRVFIDAPYARKKKDLQKASPSIF
jgi:hypothetical protein